MTYADKKDVLNREIKSDNMLIIESLYNEEFELWEVTLQGQFINYFAKEEEASSCAKSLHIAFELGYTNGLLLGYSDKEKAKRSLESRGVNFETYLDL